jgi:hypothetical protein
MLSRFTFWTDAIGGFELRCRRPAESARSLSASVFSRPRFSSPRRSLGRDLRIALDSCSTRESSAMRAEILLQLIFELFFRRELSADLRFRHNRPRRASRRPPGPSSFLSAMSDRVLAVVLNAASDPGCACCCEALRSEHRPMSAFPRRVRPDSAISCWRSRSRSHRWRRAAAVLLD